jgi:hypothetical protein
MDFINTLILNLRRKVFHNSYQKEVFYSKLISQASYLSILIMIIVVRCSGSDHKSTRQLNFNVTVTTVGNNALSIRKEVPPLPQELIQAKKSCSDF